MKAICSLLACLIAVPTGQAVVLEDPAGDVAVSVNDQDAVPVPPGVRDSVDILSLDIVEGETILAFVVDLAAYRSLEESSYVDRIISLRFDVGSREYVIMWGEITAGAVASGLYLRHDFSPWGERVGDVRVSGDAEASLYRLSVDRALVTGGTMMTNIDVTVMSHGGTSFVYLGTAGFLLLGDRFPVVVHDQAGFDVPGTYVMNAGSSQTEPGPGEAAPPTADGTLPRNGTADDAGGRDKEAAGPAAILLAVVLLGGGLRWRRR